MNALFGRFSFAVAGHTVVMTTTTFTVVLVVATLCNVFIPGMLLLQLRRVYRLLAIASAPGSSLTMVMERELTANRVALGVMQDAVEAKRTIGADVLPETYTALDLLQVQTERLAEEIAVRRRSEEMAKRRWAERREPYPDDADHGSVAPAESA